MRGRNAPGSISKLCYRDRLPHAGCAHLRCDACLLAKPRYAAMIAGPTQIRRMQFIRLCTSSSPVSSSMSRSAEELVDTRVALGVLLQHLGNGHLEVFLSDVLPSLSQRVHTWVSANRSRWPSTSDSPASVQIPRTSAPEQ